MSKLQTKYDLGFLDYLAPCLPDDEIIYLEQVLVQRTSGDYTPGYQAANIRGWKYTIWMEAVKSFVAWIAKEADNDVMYWTESFDESLAWVAGQLKAPIIYKDFAHVPETIPSSWYELDGQPADANACAHRNLGTHEDVGRQRAHEYQRLGADTVDPYSGGD